MSRAYPTHPIAGVGGLVFRGRELLLVRRGSMPSEGYWSLPGGALELGETLTEALKREVAEECGIQIKVGPPVAILDSIYRDPEGRIEYHYLLVDFWAEYVSGQLCPASDASAAAWVDLKEISKYDLTPLLRELLGHLNLPEQQDPHPPQTVFYYSLRR
ncbi:MAG: hypothetical protein PWP65_1053 [Clostridia bacterium]|nr:hypothetical protein [Clostridia bacterium]